MKELSIEEKAKRYDEALEKGKQIQNTPYTAHWDIMKEVVEHLLPELKESEDERIRKNIISWLKNIEGQTIPIDDYNSALAWLEKQGTPAKFRDSIQVGDKVTRNEDGVLVNLSQLKRVAKSAEEQGEHRTVPKFRVGDFVKYTNYHGEPIYKICSIDSQCYICAAVDGKNLGDKGVMHFSFDNPYLRLVQKSAELQQDMLSQEKYAKAVDECIYGEQEPADKIEPKFKVEDWIVYHRNDSSTVIMNVYDIRDNRYYFNDNIHFSWSVKECDEKCHLWTIQDAKDGDVLVCNEEILLFKSYSVQGRISLYCWYNGHTNNFCNKEVNNASLTTRNKIFPATKEQRDKLMKAMTDAGYTFDFNKKVLKKIEQKPTDEEMKETLRTEYEKGRADVIAEMQNHAWSEEDEEIYQSIIDDTVQENQLNDKQTNWLKSLKDRYTWKPSEEQMDALNLAIGEANSVDTVAGDEAAEILTSLYEQLKKIKGE